MAKKKPKEKDDDSSGTGEDQGLVGEARHDIAGAYDTISGGFQQGVNDIAGLDKGWDVLGLGGSSKSAAPPPETADQKEIAQLKSQLKTAQGEAGQTAPPSAYEQLADQQANQFLQASKNLDPLTSGAQLPAIESTAASNAAQMLGASSSSPVSQWLNAQTQAAQAQNAPAAAAEAQLGQAQDSAANLEATGLKNMGMAENQMLQAAPYQQLLNTLAADVPYKLLGGTPFSSLTSEVGQAVSSIPGLSTTAVPSNAASAPQINTGIVPPAPVTTTPGGPGVGS